MRHLRAASAIALVLLLASFTSVAAAGERQRADLAGVSIPLVEVGEHFCHDLDAPAIHCFGDLAALDAAVSLRQAERADALAVTYVQVFADANYGGSSAYLSASYANLGTIGWNDRISSYKVLVSGSGEFREHVNYTGIGDGFCCTQWVANVGDTYNDTFSSARML